MEGATSDLRTGLSAQMTEIHEPMRLLFVIETSAAGMLSIMQRTRISISSFATSGCRSQYSIPIQPTSRFFGTAALNRMRHYRTSYRKWNIRATGIAVGETTLALRGLAARGSYRNLECGSKATAFVRRTSVNEENCASWQTCSSSDALPNGAAGSKAVALPQHSKYQPHENPR